MLENLPSYISWMFIGTAMLTLFLFYNVLRHSAMEATRQKANIILLVLSIWLVVQAKISLYNFYNAKSNSLPPRLLLTGILPSVAAIIFLFVTSRGRKFIDSLPLLRITYLNIVRIFIEIIFIFLFANKAIPQLMTFEGRNFDILAGITAPFIAYFGFKKQMISKKIILIWNFICLLLLINIVFSAFLSAPFPFQKFAFDQPNIAMLNFPFTWLPVFIVPVILFGHLVSIRQLTKYHSSTGE